MNGTFVDDYDKDFYAFTFAAHGCGCRNLITASDQDVTLELFDADGTLIVTQQFLLPDIHLSGQYYVAVSGRRGQSYSLRFVGRGFR
jgi:hypothetical protein